MTAEMNHSTFQVFFISQCTMFNVFRSFAGTVYSLSSLAGDKLVTFSIRE